MNVADSEVVVSILSENGYEHTDDIREAGIILLNTCSIRENAEQHIRGRLKAIGHLKKKDKGILIGLIGCMAERIKEKVLVEEHLVDIVVRPNASPQPAFAYRRGRIGTQSHKCAPVAGGERC